MKFTAEQLAKAKAAKSAEELIALAKENGMELTEEEAAKYYTEWHKEGALADDELNNVSGGCGGDSSDPAPRYQNGQFLWLGYHTTHNYLKVVVDAPEFYTEEYGWRYLVTAVDYCIQQNEYLETREFVHTTDPGPRWID